MPSIQSTTCARTAVCVYTPRSNDASHLFKIHSYCFSRRTFLLPSTSTALDDISSRRHSPITCLPQKHVLRTLRSTLCPPPTPFKNLCTCVFLPLAMSSLQGEKKISRFGLAEVFQVEGITLGRKTRGAGTQWTSMMVSMRKPRV